MKIFTRPIEIYLNDLFLFTMKSHLLSLLFHLGISAFSKFLDHELPDSGFPLCFCSFVQNYSLNTYHVPDTIVDTEDSRVSKDFYFPG